MTELAIDCQALTQDVYSCCLAAAESILLAAGFTAQDVADAQRLSRDGTCDRPPRARRFQLDEALAAFHLAELAAQAESECGADCRLVLVEHRH